MKNYRVRFVKTCGVIRSFIVQAMNPDKAKILAWERLRRQVVNPDTYMHRDTQELPDNVPHVT